MAATRSKIQKNLQRIQETVAEACARSGRDPNEVRLVAVTKSAELEEVKHLVDLGVTDLGESRAQQFARRAEDLAAWLDRKRTDAPPRVRWHLIGHLQRNKVKSVLPHAAMIHSVDSLRLAEEINTRCEQAGRVMDVMLQVNCSEEDQKFGCAVGAAGHLAEMMAGMKHLRLVGLMTMAALSDNPQDARPTFTRLRELFEEMRRDRIGGDDFRHLSMGMSNDYAVAVEQGATILRIGTAIYE